MKTIYNIDNGEPITILPSRRDPGTYNLPPRTTTTPPPEFNPKTETCEFRNGQWDILNVYSKKKVGRSMSKKEMIMDLLRKERDAKLAYIDRKRKEFEEKGLEMPDRWVDYRADLLNVPQHVELGFTEFPKLSGGMLVYNDWPEPPSG